MQFETNWILNGNALEPNMDDEPAPPDGYFRSGASAEVPAGHTPEPGEPVTVNLRFSPIPPPPPPEPEAPPEEPTP